MIKKVLQIVRPAALCFQRVLNLKYPEPGSNRHGLPHWCLRPARLPEPARVAPLVFETSASTDSAIWACSFCRCFSEIGCKVNIKI